MTYRNANYDSDTPGHIELDSDYIAPDSGLPVPEYLTLEEAHDFAIHLLQLVAEGRTVQTEMGCTCDCDE